jgi:hypothetical protein
VGDMMAQVKRERLTMERIRPMGTADLVEEIHRLEDRADELEARLDAADPLRAMLGEVVEALEQSWSPYKDDTPPDVRWHARRDRILARLRTATEGGTDDGE